MVWTLPRREAIGMPVLKNKVCASVLQREAAPGRNDAGSESLIVGVDKGAAVAFTIGCCKVDCIAVVVSGRAVTVRVRDLGRVEQLCTLCQI